jgi:hypothetical protein
VRRAAARSQCANNLKQIALGLHNYAGGHPTAQDGAATTGLLPAATLPLADVPPERRLGWCVDLLPLIEQDSLYRRFDLQAPWDAAANGEPGTTVLRQFYCPDWGREKDPNPPHLTAYLGVAGVGDDAANLRADDPRAGLFGHDRRRALADIPDGASNTLLILESARDNGPWARGGPSTVRGLDPGDRPYLGTGRPFGGTHFAENSVFGKGKSIGCNAAMADGSVRFLQEKVAAEVLEALATAAGGEEVRGDW